MRGALRSFGRINVSSAIEFDSDDDSTVGGDGVQLTKGSKMEMKRGKLKISGKMESEGLLNVSAGSVEFSGAHEHRIGGEGFRSKQGSKLHLAANVTFDGETLSEGWINVTKSKIKFNKNATLKGDGLDLDKDSEMDVDNNITLGGKGARSKGKIKLRSPPQKGGSEQDSGRRLQQQQGQRLPSRRQLSLDKFDYLSVQPHSSLLVGDGGLQSDGYLYIPSGATLIYDHASDTSTVGGIGLDNLGNVVLAAGALKITSGGVRSYGAIQVLSQSTAHLTFNMQDTDSSVISGEGLKVTAPGVCSVLNGSVEILATITGKLDVSNDSVIITDNGIACRPDFGIQCTAKGKPPPVNCVGAWGACTQNCEDISFTVSTFAAHAGTECSVGNGATKACSVGDGECKAKAPPPPLTVEVQVTAILYNESEKVLATQQIAEAVAAANNDNLQVADVVKVESAVTFQVKREEIGSKGSPTYQEFKANFESAMSVLLGNLAVVMTGISDGRRRRHLVSIASSSTDGSRRRLADAVKVEFYTEAPSSVASQAASLVKTLKASKTKIEVALGGKAISADPASMAEPKVTKLANTDCKGRWSSCTAQCMKTYTHSVVAAGQGAPCSISHGKESRNCTIGEGLCEVEDKASVKMGGVANTSPAFAVLLAVTIGVVLATQ